MFNQDHLILLLLIPIILMSLSVHEFAHAFVANLFGDPTAKLEGRQTINPLAHWDSVGTTLLVGLILLQSFGIPVPAFGWGKPVPVNESNFDNPKLYGLQTALAGPLSNFLLAAILGLVIRLTHLPPLALGLAITTIYLNLFLMFFNLIPVPPLDGSRILRLFMSDQLYYSLASNPILFIALVFVAFYFLIDYLIIASQFLTTFLSGIH
jgi:Zn-dependent protease